MKLQVNLNALKYWRDMIKGEHRFHEVIIKSQILSNKFIKKIREFCHIVYLQKFYILFKLNILTGIERKTNNYIPPSLHFFPVIWFFRKNQSLKSLWKVLYEISGKKLFVGGRSLLTKQVITRISNRLHNHNNTNNEKLVFYWF